MNYQGVYDIECGNWTEFRLGRFTSRDGTRSFESRDEGVFFSTLVAQGGVWYGHFGGKYDALWIADMAVKAGIPWTATMRGAGIMSLKLPGGFEARDSYALIPMRLADAARMGGAEKLEVGFPCECGTSCGGFCVLARDMSPGEWASLSAYLAADCECLIAALDAAADIAAEHGISLGLTVGGTAWKTAKQWCPGVSGTTHDVASYHAVRAGYYGGRTEVYVSRAPVGERYDIHSSYPAALSRTPTPVGARRMVAGAAARRAFASQKPGVYTATVTVPEHHYSPPLPMRTPERLYFPTGRFEGIWTGLELAHAVECGATIVAIDSAIVWDTTDLVFAPYADRIWAIRDGYAREESREGIARAAWVKWLANSLTGRLAIRPDHESLQFVTRDSDGMISMAGDYDVLRDLPGGAFISVSSQSIDPSAHVEAAAYLTASARVELHMQLLHAGSSALYCDTDSVYSAVPLTRGLGDNLGEWGYEGDLREWDCLAPKVYRYQSGEKVKVKAKGMSDLDSAGFDALADGGEWQVNRGVESVKTAISRKRDSLFERKCLTRSLSPKEGWIGGRRHDADLGTTAPPTASEALAASTASEECHGSDRDIYSA